MTSVIPKKLAPSSQRGSLDPPAKRPSVMYAGKKNEERDGSAPCVECVKDEDEEHATAQCFWHRNLRRDTELRMEVLVTFKIDAPCATSLSDFNRLRQSRLWGAGGMASIHPGNERSTGDLSKAGVRRAVSLIHKWLRVEEHCTGVRRCNTREDEAISTPGTWGASPTVRKRVAFEEFEMRRARRLSAIPAVSDKAIFVELAG
ncbi:hypothetical protein R3P38DRAFT_2811502 [Favolaschia claudopus]|uniref:Uncharacterized protein n=1 Tax=Favolaschia claudopus TaxID=2862362 RepID=A0AAV9Z939_9AGAR